ncbi:MAG: hypothetical protein ACTJHT_02155 [Sphingobacterium sp.]|nr:hypothetical protein [Sphingobacterium sp. JB170]SJN39819.1 hypothetical protein FM107_10305 [Sphingobacterium sp. JB170]
MKNKKMKHSDQAHCLHQKEKKYNIQVENKNAAKGVPQLQQIPVNNNI